jgi:uncharacterized membrane protein
MNKTLKVAHFVGLALFLGSIPGHILLGRLADPAADLQGFALLMHANYVNGLAFTLPGLFLMLLTGIVLMLRRGLTPNRYRWMAVKLMLVSLIALNATFILRPLAGEIADTAGASVSAGSLPAGFADLERREGIFGAVNLAMILAVVGLTVFKPGLRRGEAKPGRVLS